MPVTLPLLIYLDTNVYSRPFDDQTNEKIYAEANAFLKILAMVKAGTLDLLSSDILKLEVDEVLDKKNRLKIISYLEWCNDHINSSAEILKLGKAIKKTAMFERVRLYISHRPLLATFATFFRVMAG